MSSPSAAIGLSMLIVVMLVYVALRYKLGSKIGKLDLGIVAMASLLLGAQCPKIVGVAQMLGEWIINIWTWLAGLISG